MQENWNISSAKHATIGTPSCTKGRIISLYLTGGNVSDHKGVEFLLERLLKRVEHLLGEMGYESTDGDGVDVGKGESIFTEF